MCVEPGLRFDEKRLIFRLVRDNSGGIVGLLLVLNPGARLGLAASEVFTQRSLQALLARGALRAVGHEVNLGRHDPKGKPRRPASVAPGVAAREADLPWEMKMSRTSIAVGLTAALLAPSVVLADSVKVIAPPAISWVDAGPNLPKGAHFALLAGNPAKPEAYVARARFPAGYVVPPHAHSKPEYVTVLTGTLHIGTGAKFDKARAEPVGPGGLYAVPAGTPHFAWAEAETIVQISGLGPGDVTYANPSDDPARAAKN